MAATKPQTADHVLVSSTLGLICGLFLMVAGRDIMAAIDGGSYTTVLGLELIDSSLVWLGLGIAVISLFGIVIGVWRSVR